MYQRMESVDASRAATDSHIATAPANIHLRWFPRLCLHVVLIYMRIYMNTVYSASPLLRSTLGSSPWSSSVPAMLETS